MRTQFLASNTLSLVWLRDVLIDWAVIIGCLLLAGVSYALILPAAWIIGNRLHALALLGHDGTHRLVWPKNKLANDLLSNLLCFVPAALPFYGYRRFHWEHHRKVGTDQDPELPRKEAAGIKPPTSNKEIIWQYVKDLFGLGILDFKNLALPRSWPWDYLQIVLFFVLQAAIFFFLGPIANLCWILGIATSLIATSRLRIWYEHVGANHTHKLDPTWWQCMLFLPHNAAYHWEHHQHSAVPYNKLPEIADKNRIKIKDVHKQWK